MEFKHWENKVLGESKKKERRRKKTRHNQELNWNEVNLFNNSMHVARRLLQ